MAMPAPAAFVLPNKIILPKQKQEANELKITPITKEALWESSIEEHHLSSLVLLSLLSSVPATSLALTMTGVHRLMKDLT